MNKNRGSDRRSDQRRKENIPSKPDRRSREDRRLDMDRRS